MLNIMRIVGYLEGLSFLALLFVAMPMKYLLNDASLIAGAGMAHGVLFLLYVAVLFVTSHTQKWPVSTFLMGLLASVLPFGPFIFDKKVIAAAKTAAA